MSKTLDSFETFYKFNKVNEKDPVVFIHGVGLTNEMWDPQVNFFKDDYNLLTYDLPGHGNTPLKKGKLSFDDYYNQLLNLIKELNFNKIHLIGFSLGALIARDFASKHPDWLSFMDLRLSWLAPLLLWQADHRHHLVLHARIVFCRLDHRPVPDSVNGS